MIDNPDDGLRGSDDELQVNKDGSRVGHIRKPRPIEVQYASRAPHIWEITVAKSHRAHLTGLISQGQPCENPRKTILRLI